MLPLVAADSAPLIVVVVIIVQLPCLYGHQQSSDYTKMQYVSEEEPRSKSPHLIIIMAYLLHASIFEKTSAYSSASYFTYC